MKSVLRRRRDSNSRYSFPYTHFPGVLLQPLGHISIVEKVGKANVFKTKMPHITWGIPYLFLISLSAYFITFCLGYYFFFDVTRRRSIMAELHGRRCTARRQRTKLRYVTEHFAQWNFSFNNLCTCTAIHTFQHRTTTVEIARYITHVLFRSNHFYFH